MNRSRARRPILLAALSCAALVFAAAPALAAPLDGGHFVEVETYTDTVCGEEWNVETTTEGHFMIKAGRAGDPTPYYLDNTSEVSVYTDPDDPDRGFVTSSHSVFKDVRITLISGTTYLFETMRVGRSAIETLGGRPVAQDDGQTLWAFTVDTKGGSDLEDYELLGEALIRTTGNDTLAEADEPAFCDLVAEAIAG